MIAASTSPKTGERITQECSKPEEPRAAGAVEAAGEQPGADRMGAARHNGASPSLDVGNKLMLELQGGEQSALNRLFALYNPKLYSFIFRIVGDATTAEDIIQETWLTLYERRGGYQPTYKFSTWLFTIARRKALSELRRRSVRSAVRSLTFQSKGGESEELETPQNTFCGPDVTADGALVSGIVEKALARLSPQHREIVILRDIEGFESDEIAQILQWSLKPGALRKRIFDAREAFRKAMLALGYKE